MAGVPAAGVLNPAIPLGACLEYMMKLKSSKRSKRGPRLCRRPPLPGAYPNYSDASRAFFSIFFLMFFLRFFFDHFLWKVRRPSERGVLKWCPKRSLGYVNLQYFSKSKTNENHCIYYDLSTFRLNISVQVESQFIEKQTLEILEILVFFWWVKSWKTQKKEQKGGPKMVPKSM